MKDYFACTEDGASMEGSCTGTEEDNFDAAEQELDEESVAVEKGDRLDKSKRFREDR